MIPERLDTDPGGLTVFRIPKSHWHCTLWNFQWATVRPASLQEHVLALLHAVQAGQPPHLILTGQPGIGKTHLGVGMYRAGVVAWGTELVTWLNVPAFCERVKRTYDQSVVDPWYDVESAKRLVVLDDLFGKELTQYETNQILVRILDTVYQNGAALLVSMNPDIKAASERIMAHEMSRLLAESTVIPMQADKDRRRG